MISLNDYLYSGDTVLKILHNYSEDLRSEGRKCGNEIDLLHSNYLLRIIGLLEQNEFLTGQSQKIREFYMYMAGKYPELAFTFKGRIKSLIRAESKFNRYIVDDIYDYYKENGVYLPVDTLKKRVEGVRDLIAYRIVISIPRCHLENEAQRQKEELKYLYEIANQLPDFLEERGFEAQPAYGVKSSQNPLMGEHVKPFYRDYIGDGEEEYQSLHITFYDYSARCYMEVQIRTKTMDDNAEIGPANHLGYEKRQADDQAKRALIPTGENIYFDEAYERGVKLQRLDLSKVDVNMFGAVNNQLVNDGCGLYRGRLILPYEHLSRFQNDRIM